MIFNKDPTHDNDIVMIIPLLPIIKVNRPIVTCKSLQLLLINFHSRTLQQNLAVISLRFIDYAYTD